MANSRTQANDFPPDRWILLSLCLATFVAACVAGIVDVYTGGISAVRSSVHSNVGISLRPDHAFLQHMYMSKSSVLCVCV